MKSNSLGNLSEGRPAACSLWVIPSAPDAGAWWSF